MVITKISLRQFTAFERLELVPSPGINVLIGTNATGKTHLMKVAYAACAVVKEDGTGFGEKLVRVFLPSQRKLGRLARRVQGVSRASVSIHRGERRLTLSFAANQNDPRHAETKGEREWVRAPLECTYIPVKEMLANAPGFLSLYKNRETHFEEVYADLLHRAYLPLLKGPMEETRKRISNILRQAIGGKVRTRGEEFFLESSKGSIEFTLLAEGYRKLALLWLLTQNGVLLSDKPTVLFWDEPEANLNPGLVGDVVDFLLELQRCGVQVFVATHDYVVLKEFDLRKTGKDQVVYHALYREKNGGPVNMETCTELADVHRNAILETFSRLYERQMDRVFADTVAAVVEK